MTPDSSLFLLLYKKEDMNILISVGRSMFIKGLLIATMKQNNHTLASFSSLPLGIIYEHLTCSTVTLGKRDLCQPYLYH